MGRLAMHLAAKVAHADNLPSSKQLPQVSFWDALLPKDSAVAIKKPSEKKEKEVR